MHALLLDPLSLWAVWRSLDTVSGAAVDHTGATAPERLARWKTTGADDAAILTEIQTIYAYNPSMRAPGEPVVTVKADYRLPASKGKPAMIVPAIWFSRDNPEPQFVYKPKKKDWDFSPPQLMGQAIVDVVRHLMRMDEPPTF